MAQDDKPRCTPIEHRGLMPGWGCCVCRTYNGEQRERCKHCDHARCDLKPENRPS